MTKKELLELLQPFPDDMEIWVSDRGYCEGGIPLEKVEKASAYDADLEGDLINDEYYYTEDMKEIEIEEYLEKGYLLSKDGNVLYKEIILFNYE